MRSGTPEERRHSAENLRKELVQAMTKSLDLLPAPEGGEANRRFFEDKDDFVQALNPSSTHYIRSFSPYLGLLAESITNKDHLDLIFSNHFINEEKCPEEIDEIQELFKAPQKIMGHPFSPSDEIYYRRTLGFFGVGSYNFNNHLLLFLKIVLLENLAEKSFITAEIFDDYFNSLRAEVITLKEKVQQEKVSDIVTIPEPEQKTEAPKKKNATLAHFVEHPDDTLDHHRRYGYVPPLYLDPFKFSFWPQYWDYRHEDPLQMPNSKSYPWSERAMYFFLGSDVRKYFKDSMRYLKTGYYLFFGGGSDINPGFIRTITRRHYYFASAFAGCCFIGWMAGSLLSMFLCDLPTAFLKGLLGLPGRLIHRTTGLHLNGIPERILVGALYLGVRLPLVIAFIPVRLAIFVGVTTIALLYGSTTAFIIKPIASGVGRLFSGIARLFRRRPPVNQPQPQNVLQHIIAPLEPSQGEEKRDFKSASFLKLNSIVSSDPTLQCSIDGVQVTSADIQGELNRLRSNNANLPQAPIIQPLTAKIVARETLVVDYAPPNTPAEVIKHHFVMGDTFNPEKHQSKVASVLVFDWSFYNRTPALTEMDQVANFLKEQKTLNELRLLGYVDPSSICQALIDSPHLNPMVIDFGSKEPTIETFQILARLLESKHSITTIHPPLPQNLQDLKGIKGEQDFGLLCNSCFRVKHLLLRNRRENSLEPSEIEQVREETGVQSGKYFPAETADSANETAQVDPATLALPSLVDSGKSTLFQQKSDTSTTSSLIPTPKKSDTSTTSPLTPTPTLENKKSRD